MTFAFWDPAGDEPVYASRLNAGALWEVDDIAELEATDATDLPTNSKVLVQDDGVSPVASLYLYNKSSSATADGFSIVEPDVGGGRYFRQAGSDNAISVSQTSHGFTELQPVFRNNSLSITLAELVNQDESFTAEGATLGDFKMYNNGTVAFSLNAGSIDQYTITNGDISTKSFVSTYAAPANTTAFDFSSDGLIIYFAIDTGTIERVDAYAVGTAFTLSTVGALLYTGADLSLGTISSLQVLSSTKVFIYDETGTLAIFYSMTGGDTSTMGSANTATVTSANGAVSFSDGSKVIFFTSNSAMNEWVLSTPYSFSAGYYINPKSRVVSYSNGNNCGISDDDKYFFTVSTNETVDQYRMDDHWQLADARNPLTCRDVWLVSKVIDTNNFTVAKSGAFKIESHGLKGSSTLKLRTSDFDTVAWQSGNTVRHTWGTNVDLSFISAGDWVFLEYLINTSSDQTEEQATHFGCFPITAVSDGSNYIEWKNIYTTSATEDPSYLVDGDNFISVYGNAISGDVSYLSEEPGVLSPFPANGGAVELPLLTVIDDDNVLIHCPIGIPASKPKLLVVITSQETPNDADDDYDLEGRHIIDLSNPQNWNLKFNMWATDGTSEFGVVLEGVTHGGGVEREFTWTDSGADPTTSNDSSNGASLGAGIVSSDLELEFQGIYGGSGLAHMGWGEMVYDGNVLTFTSHTNSEDGIGQTSQTYYNVDLSSASIARAGVTNLDNFSLTIQRV